MWNIKMLASVFSAMILAIASVGTSVSVFAEEAESTTMESTAITEIAEVDEVETASETDKQLDAEDMKTLVEEIQNDTSADKSESSEHDFYDDGYYDTDGNATLIKHEKIIYDSEEIQFIAVTTKDGNVFYVLINYSAEGNEDNVFFLNKVDDFDLYSLLYAGNESEECADPIEQARKYADAATGGNTQESDAGNVEESTDNAENGEEVSATQQSAPMNSNLLIIGGVAVLAVIGGAIFVLKSGKGKHKKTQRLRTLMKIMTRIMVMFRRTMYEGFKHV